MLLLLLGAILCDIIINRCNSMLLLLLGVIVCYYY